jgi:hypothetical protein
MRQNGKIPKIESEKRFTAARGKPFLLNEDRSL